MTQNIVPLHKLGELKFINNTIGMPTLNNILCGCIPDGIYEFKNSVKKCTDSSLLTTESMKK